MENLDELLPEENKKPKQNQGNAAIKIAIMALLALPISWNTSTDSRDKDSVLSWQVDEQKNKNIVMDESLDVVSEQLFKTAVAEALIPINDLQDIPVWGIPLKYQSSVAENLPKTIDFYPKKMVAKTLPFTIVIIGKTMYVVTPELWFAVDKMYIDEKSFTIAVSQNTIFGEIRKEVSKSKNKEMPDYLTRLLTEGEKWHYIWSSVKVITSREVQAEYLKKLNELNK